MPTYNFRNNETGEVIQRICSNKAREELLATGEWTQVHLDTPKLVTHTGNIVNKTSGDWKDVLKNIKKSTPGNTIKV